MREIFKSGSVGGAPGNRCFYLEADLFHSRLIFMLGMENAFYLSSKNLDLYIIIIYTFNQWKRYLNNFQASSGTEGI